MTTPSFRHIFPGATQQYAAAVSGGSRGIGEAVMRALKTGGKITAMGALAPVGALALLALLEARREAKEKLSRSGDFQAILEEAPSLKENKDKAKKHFMTLRRLAPDISKDPVLSAGYIKKVQAYENEGVDPALVSQLLLRKPDPTVDIFRATTGLLPATKVDVPSWEL